jgi:hypothetical protein
MPQLTNLVKTILCKNSVVAGATDITDATVVDTAGYDGVRFIFGFGTITRRRDVDRRRRQGDRTRRRRHRRSRRFEDHRRRHGR